MFCLVLLHLFKNVHRYFKLDSPSEFQKKLLEDKSLCDTTRQKVIDKFKEANKRICEVRDLKGKNRVCEHQERVASLKKNYHSFRNMSLMSGISLKTVHNWCSLPKQKQHRATEMSKMRRKEFEEFLLQDTISFAHPCKKYSGK